MAIEFRGEEILYVIEAGVDASGARLLRPFNQTGGSTEISADTIDMESKDKSGADYGKVSQTVSLEGVLTETDETVPFIITAMRTKQPVKIFEVNTRTKEAESGLYTITSFNMEYSNGDFATYSLEGALNGDVAKTTLTTIPGGAAGSYDADLSALVQRVTMLEAVVASDTARIDKLEKDSLPTLQTYGADDTGIEDVSVPIQNATEEADTIRVTKGVYSVGTNVTIPKGKTLVFDSGATLVVAAGVTLTINGHIIASPKDFVVDLSAGGTVAGTPTVDEIYLEWFGGKSDGTIDCGAILNSISTLFINRGIRIKLGRGTYLFSTELKNMNNIYVEGDSNIKHYWAEYNDYDEGTVVAGNGSNVLLGVGMKRSTFVNVSFRNFSRIAGSLSPRSARFMDCSFKNMTVLSAPDSTSDKNHNFSFYRCSFTVFEVDSAFVGRLIDCKWSDCIFVGASGLDLNQSKACEVSNCRFEWIDRKFAIALYDCDNIQILGNFFDRISGNAIQIKQKNIGIQVADNVMNRSGTGKSSAGTDLAYEDRYLSHIQLWGEFDSVIISDNIFSKDKISDAAGTVEESPKYCVTKEPNATGCFFDFKNNEFSRGYSTEAFLVLGDASKIRINGDSTFGNLSESVVSLSRYSGQIVTAYNTGTVSVTTIPPKLRVVNSGSIALTGAQDGIVVGGRVNGRLRYTSEAVIADSYVEATADGATGTYRRVDIPIAVSKAMLGTTITVSFVYNTTGTPNLGVDATKSNGDFVRTLTSYVASDTNMLHRVSMYIPETYDDSSLVIRVYASKATTAEGTVTVKGHTVSYGNQTSPKLIDMI